jgi:hypothetical protein
VAPQDEQRLYGGLGQPVENSAGKVSKSYYFDGPGQTVDISAGTTLSKSDMVALIKYYTS